VKTTRYWLNGKIYKYLVVEEGKWNGYNIIIKEVLSNVK